MNGDEFAFWCALISAVFITIVCIAMTPIADNIGEEVFMGFAVGLISIFWIFVGYRLKIAME